MNIAFVWQGYDAYKDKWNDGLRAAMRVIEKQHTVIYYDTERVPFIPNFHPDIVLYWEAPVTQRGKDADKWNAVVSLPYKKALLFAGGPLRAMDVKDFDLVFVESQINVDDCERQGIPYRKAFGTNTQIFKPETVTKYHRGLMQATFAGWKRHELFAEALKGRGTAVGRKQNHDLHGYNICTKLGVVVFDEVLPEQVAHMINASHVVVNTSNAEGGGQRCTLEAMACGVPVVVMSDSPKNREFVEASGGGLIAEPTPESIQYAVEEAIIHSHELGKKGYAYIKENLTEEIYAREILAGINSL